MRRFALGWILVALWVASSPVRAEWYADFRLRSEADFDSQTDAGVPRDDRTRLRVRARIGTRWDIGERWRLEFRLRSGQRESQQSPHVTVLDFDGNDTGETSFDFDRWYLRRNAGNYWAVAGRNSLPIWKQTEELFDDDATFAGIGLGGEHRLQSASFSWSGGYYSSPVGMRALSGKLGVLQGVYRAGAGNVRWTVALGGFRHKADADDPDAATLLQNNGLRDYSIVELSIQARSDFGDRPLIVGADRIRNFENYASDDSDPITAANANRTDGYVVLVRYGELDEARDWDVGYEYARVELLAVNNSYAQDDWVRWGSATQTRASNRRGHQLRFGWALSGHANVVARLYLAEAVTGVEDGKRFRVDLNLKF